MAQIPPCASFPHSWFPANPATATGPVSITDCTGVLSPYGVKLWGCPAPRPVCSFCCLLFGAAGSAAPPRCQASWPSCMGNCQNAGLKPRRFWNNWYSAWWSVGADSVRKNAFCLVSPTAFLFYFIWGWGADISKHAVFKVVGKSRKGPVMSWQFGPSDTCPLWISTSLSWIYANLFLATVAKRRRCLSKRIVFLDLDFPAFGK